MADVKVVYRQAGFQTCEVVMEVEVYLALGPHLVEEDEARLPLKRCRCQPETSRESSHLRSLQSVTSLRSAPVTRAEIVSMSMILN